MNWAEIERELRDKIIAGETDKYGNYLYEKPKYILLFFKQKFKEAFESLLPGEEEYKGGDQSSWNGADGFNACREEMRGNLEKFFNESGVR